MGCRRHGGRCYKCRCWSRGLFSRKKITEAKTDKGKEEPTPIPVAKAIEVAGEELEKKISLHEDIARQLRQISASLDSDDLHQSIASTLEKINDVYNTLAASQEELSDKPEFEVFLNGFMDDLKAINKKMEIYYDNLLLNKELFQQTLHKDGPIFIKLSKLMGKTLRFTEGLKEKIARLEAENKALVEEVTQLKEENHSLRQTIEQANRSQTPVAGFFKPKKEAEQPMPTTLAPKK